MDFTSNTITIENWTTARFKQADMLSFISLGAAPSGENSNETSYVYSVIVSDLEYVEISEQCFNTLMDAIQSINNRFSGWELTFLGAKSGEGCDSCAAH